jgi:chorismate-pyruvate lyase
MNQASDSMPDLNDLVSLFYDDSSQLGVFDEVAAEEMPEVYRGLLAHEEHMTVTVEAFHHSPVDVVVLATKVASPHYSRKILLNRESDAGVVQFGIVRLNTDYVDAEVRREIESQQIPLGRVLINHNVLRQVQLTSLWRIKPGPDLCKLFGLEKMVETYGRTALIYCNGEPAVELIEIVIPAK